MTVDDLMSMAELATLSESELVARRDEAAMALGRFWATPGAFAHPAAADPYRKARDMYLGELRRREVVH
jgi:hypothetical protein